MPKKRKKLLIYDVDLAWFHGGECTQMAFRSYAGTAFGIYIYRDFWESVLGQHSIGDYTDVCAKTDDSDGVDRFLIIECYEPAYQFKTAERGFVDDFAGILF